MNKLITYSEIRGSTLKTVVDVWKSRSINLTLLK